jgi:Phage integrase, N-terminal SAM-like domain
VEVELGRVDDEMVIQVLRVGQRVQQLVDRSRAGKVKLADYATTWITQRPKLRPRTVDLYRWLLKRHITPYLGGVSISKLSTSMILEWRAELLSNGASVSMAAKSYRLLRPVLMTAVEEDKILPQNPCRIRGAGDENAAERPVLTVARVFELAERVGRHPVGNIRKSRRLATGSGLHFHDYADVRVMPMPGRMPCSAAVNGLKVSA